MSKQKFMGSAFSAKHLDNAFVVQHPIVVMFRNDEGNVTTHIHPQKTDRYEYYGLYICDLIRHVARAFKVDEDDVWEWVEKERHHPTTEIKNPS